MKRLILLAMVLAPLVVGCGDSSSRPGTLLVAVEWDEGAAPLGAALVFLSGHGLGEPLTGDGAMVWSHTPAGEEGGLRVLVVHPGNPGALEFEVPVADRRQAAPEAHLLGLAGQDNAFIPSESPGYHVRFLGTP